MCNQDSIIVHAGKARFNMSGRQVFVQPFSKPLRCNGFQKDLVFQFQGKRYGMEIKFNEAPSLTPSMRIAAAELELDHLWIVYPGSETYPVGKKITTLPLKNLEDIREQLKGL